MESMVFCGIVLIFIRYHVFNGLGLSRLAPSLPLLGLESGTGMPLVLKLVPEPFTPEDLYPF